MYRIFIAEDDGVIATALQQHLEGWGFAVRCAVDFSAVLQELIGFDPQLVLLDISLPFYNGFHWCQELRRVSSIPILFLSSASDNMNILTAINMGADDFIAKPFDLSILMAKIQALLRRSYDYQGQSRLIEHNGALFNQADCSVSHGEQRAELTKNENRILQALLENKGKVVTREQLMTLLWQCDAFVDENTLSVNLARLRKKLSGIGLEDFITTKKGLGYLVD